MKRLCAVFILALCAAAGCDEEPMAPAELPPPLEEVSGPQSIEENFTVQDSVAAACDFTVVGNCFCDVSQCSCGGEYTGTWYKTGYKTCSVYCCNYEVDGLGDPTTDYTCEAIDYVNYAGGCSNTSASCCPSSGSGSGSGSGTSTSTGG